MKSSIAPLVNSSAVKKKRNKRNHTATRSVKMILFYYIIKDFIEESIIICSDRFECQHFPVL